MTETYIELICQEAIKTYGEQSQKFVAIEEMAELTKELIKDYRGIGNIKNIIEEIADAKIMIKQLEIIYGKDLIDLVTQEKIDRLDQRMSDGIGKIKSR